MRVLLLGIGNLLWADEGFGVRVIEHLQQHYVFPEQVSVLDGGTQGLYLVEHVQDCELLILFDSIDYGLSPGSLKCLFNEDVPQFLGAKKMSLHQTGFQEVLATAQMLGTYPQQLLLIGVQPEELDDFGGSLRDCVKAQIQPAIDIALDYLKTFDIVLEKRQQPETLLDPMLNIQRYEQERPSPNTACRLGDERIVWSNAFELQAPNPLDTGNLQVDIDYRGKY